MVMNIKFQLRIIFALAVLGVFVSFGHALAANWYVDNAAAGANNGVTWSNAWTSFGAIKWGSGGVSPGDTLYISGGSSSKNYSGALDIGASGASGQPISIRVGQDSGHNGTVVMDLNGASFGSAISINGRSYLTISGNVGGDRRLKIKNIYNSTNRDTASAIGGVGTEAGNIIVEYVDIENCNNGFYVSYPNGPLEIRYSRIVARGDASIRISTSDAVQWDRFKIHHNEIVTTVGTNGAPDGIACSHSASIYNNTFKLTSLNAQVSDQHPDYIQTTGNNLKIYSNEFIDIADSGVDFDAFSNGAPNNIWIYNNIFRIVNARDPYPEYIRIYTSTANKISSLKNLKIWNNLFVDQNASGKKFVTLKFDISAGADSSGNEIKNNIFYNCGDGSSSFPVTAIQQIGNTFSWDANVYYYPGGTAYVQWTAAPTWVANYEPRGLTSAPSFVSYSAYNSGNDYHPALNSNVINRGVNLSNYFNTDKDGKTRTDTWDIGPYEYGGTAPSPYCGDTTCNNAETCSTCPSDCGQCQVVPACTGCIEAESGTLASPMVKTGDSSASGGYYIGSPTAEAGTASINFNIATPGTYKFSTRVFAATGGNDSFYFKVDSNQEDTWDLNPQEDPAQYNTWINLDINKRGSGTFDNPQYQPYTVYLTAGTHTLTLRGREANTKLDYFKPVPVQASAKKGDLNADNKVDVTDLGIFLANWGKTTKPTSDLNQDGKVDVTDLGILLGNWG